MSNLLNKHIGIDIFWCYSITNKGRFSFITTHSDSAAQFWNQGLFRNHPHFRHPRFYQPGLVSLQETSNKEYDATQGALRGEGLVNDPGVIFDKTPTGLLGFGFASTRPDCNVSEIIADNTPLILEFAAKIRHGGCDNLLQLSREASLDLSKLEGHDYDHCPSYCLTTNERNQRFLDAMQSQGEDSLNGNALSLREKEVLYWTLRGRSAGQISAILHRSKRTVESHLINIKNRFGISQKTELFDLFLHLLPEFEQEIP